MCQVSVGVLGDVCRAIEDTIAPYCDRLMAVLLQNLQSDAVCINDQHSAIHSAGLYCRSALLLWSSLTSSAWHGTTLS